MKKILTGVCVSFVVAALAYGQEQPPQAGAPRQPGSAAGPGRGGRSGRGGDSQYLPGRELWSAELAGNAKATPLTCLGKDGKQYVSIVGQGGLGTFALP